LRVAGITWARLAAQWEADLTYIESLLQGDIDYGLADPYIYFYLAEAKILRGALDEARSVVDQLEELPASTFYVRLARADLAIEVDDWIRVEEELHVAEEALFEGSFNALQVAARWMRTPGGTQAALKFTDRWMAARPFDWQAHVLLAVLIQDNDPARSAAEAQLARELFDRWQLRSPLFFLRELPEFLQPFEAYIKLLNGDLDEDERLQQLERWAEERPDSVGVHRMLAVALERRDPEASVEHTRIAEDIIREHSDQDARLTFDWEFQRQYVPKRLMWPPEHPPFD